MKTLLLVLGGWYLLAGIVTFFMFGWDKRSAKKDHWRTPEKTLHGATLAGGWLGALIGMQVFRHKRAKPSFYLVTWGITLLHLILIGVLLWLWLRPSE